MEKSEAALTKRESTGKGVFTAYGVLSFLPLSGTVGILLGGIMGLHLLTWLSLFTLVMSFYLGIITWIVLVGHLFVNKMITLKQILYYTLLLSLGFVSAYFVVVYDVFSSGAKYID